MNSAVCISLTLLLLAVSTSAMPPLGTDDCPGSVDVVIAIPAEQFHPSSDFENFLDDLMLYFNIESGDVHIGLIIYKSDAVVVLPLAKGVSPRRVNTGITQLSRRSMFFATIGNQPQRLDKTLRTMGKMFQESGRSNVRKVGVLFSAGYISTNIDQGLANIAAAQQLQEAGVMMYHLGSGTRISAPREFELIGTDVCRLFGLGNFRRGLPVVLPYLASAICSELDASQDVKVGNCFPKWYAKRSLTTTPCPAGSYGLYPDESNCAYYLYCLHGHFLSRFQCPYGTLFDPQGRYCNYEHLVDCD